MDPAGASPASRSSFKAQMKDTIVTILLAPIYVPYCLVMAVLWAHKERKARGE
jgi:hypothetical protein